MDEKTFSVLEYPKILERLGAHAAFSASAALVRALRPTNDLELAQERLTRTTEARRLLIEQPQVSVGSAHDIRPQVNLAERGGVLSTEELMDIKGTLISARELFRFFEKQTQAYPHLACIAVALPPPPGLIEAISRVFSERGEMLDNASEKLASLRREMRVAHERLISKLERLINDPHNMPMLQEPIFTLRNGRYVIPVRAEYKNKLKGLTQDQSSSGATLFIEPLAVVELNNRWHEAQLAEQEEVRRILAELSALVGSNGDALLDIVRCLATLDLAFACAKYAEDLHAAEPILLPSPETDRTQPILQLIQARHPLLDPESVVPIDVSLEKGVHALVITGPNTGGKTVTLKTVGLLALMAQSGLHIPARSGSQMCIFKDIYADIGDEQSIEQSLSTFSSHITNIVRILKRLNHTTLVLLDELGAGTDPQEGSALARAILGYLVVRKVPCLVATHYPELKAYAHATPGVINSSVEFDLKTLRPTYHLTMGLPGRSNALAIAQRLGLSEQIIRDARELVNPTDLRAEDLLDEIHRQRDTARAERAAAEADRHAADELLAELEQRFEKIEEERQLILENARREAGQELENIRKEITSARHQLLSTRKSEEPLKAIRERVQKLEERISQPVEYNRPVLQEVRPLRVGDSVHLRSLNVDGEVIALKEDELEVMVGKMRLKVPVTDIQRSRLAPTAAAKEEDSGSLKIEHAGLYPSPGSEIHLRGMRADAAIEKLEGYLDAAYAAGLPYVRIVHGKGTGTLRQVVRQVLGESPLVKTWEVALDNEGGEGVTVAHLHTE